MKIGVPPHLLEIENALCPHKQDGLRYWAYCQQYEDGYDCFVPDIEDAAAAAHSLDEALNKTARKATWCIWHLIQTDQPVPKPSDVSTARKLGEDQAKELEEFSDGKVLRVYLTPVLIDFDLLKKPSADPSEEQLSLWQLELEKKQGYKPIIMDY